MDQYILARCAAVAIALGAPPALASDPRLPEDDKSIFNVTLENDLFANQDDGYTNGIRFAWLSSEAQAPQFTNWIANNLLPDAPSRRQRLSLAVGQSMFTPTDTQTRTPIPNDRPYAGWLYGSVGMTSDTGKELDNMVLTVGVIGPKSHAQQAQNFVHKVIGTEKANGWDNQLEDELGVELSYEHKWRGLYEFSPFGIGFDATPHAGFNLGNVHTDAIGGVTFRLGYDLPADYGPPRIRPSLPGSDFFLPTQTIGGYLFGGLEGRAVARNIFLDGNTFEDSISVDKKHWVGSAQLGAALTYKDTRLSYTHVFMTKEYDQQREPEQFGVVTLSMRF